MYPHKAAHGLYFNWYGKAFDNDHLISRPANKQFVRTVTDVAL